MRNKLFYLCLMLLFVACAKELTPEEQALKAAQESAKTSYDHLLAGRYDQWVKGRAGLDSISDEYRRQLEASAAQFMAQQRKAHHGVTGFDVLRSQCDSSLHIIQVFFQVNYADSTSEEIVVPMVEVKDGIWKIK